jgi:hypothetical protein
MPRKKQSRGGCAFCGKEMTKGGLTKHLKTCVARHKAIENTETDKKTAKKKQSLFHLQVKDAYLSDFWLHLEINGHANLGDLDQYLRVIWLECCGHLSQFSVGGWGGEELSMEVNIERIFTPGLELTHIYDFGTSSETLITAVDVRQGIPLTKHPIYLMARNKIPETSCAECGKPSGWLCMECLIEEGEWITLCEEHVKTHPHDNYGEPIELVNSPRLGMCGYTGPADPPY